VHLVGFIRRRQLFVTAPTFGPTTNHRSNPFQSSSTDVLRGPMPLSISSLQVLPGMLQDQGNVDQKSLFKKKMM
jgi:hypothetical protein